MNILCAALIRYPWKKRQTGFVVTHVGLLTLLLGSYYSVRTADEGQVGMLEGDVKGELVRIDYPVIRVLKSTPTPASTHARPICRFVLVRSSGGRESLDPRAFSGERFRSSRLDSWGLRVLRKRS